MKTNTLTLILAAALAATSYAAVDTLHHFTGGADDGAFPHDALTISGSILYGVTPLGGSAGEGMVFRMNTDGTGFSLLRSFAGGASDGKNPYHAMTLSGSTLYGAAPVRNRGGAGRG